MARGLDKENNVAAVPPRKNPFRQEIVSQEGIESKRKEEAAKGRIKDMKAREFRRKTQRRLETEARERLRKKEKKKPSRPSDVLADGTQVWKENGQIHRQGGPAVVRIDGTREWYRHGQRHRQGGPAVITGNGIEEWWENNQRHRQGGPAVIYPWGKEEWWIDGQKVSPTGG